MFWSKLSHEEISSLSKEIPVILFTGAIEQHGKHLPLETDTYIASRIAQAIDEEIKDKALILPICPIGYSKHHAAFCGTLTVSHATLINYYLDILKCVIECGFKNILIVNTHGGNQFSIGVVAEELGHTYQNCNIAHTSWWRLGGADFEKLNESGFGGVGHACEFETSLIMYLEPNLLRQHSFEIGMNLKRQNKEPKWAASDMLRASKVSLSTNIERQTKNGIFGNPKFSSKKKGEELFSLIVRELTTIIGEFNQLSFNG